MSSSFYPQRLIGFLFLIGVILLLPWSDSITIAQGNRHIYLPLVSAQVPVVIPDTTVPLNDAALQALTDVADDGTYTFRDTAPILDDIDVGDVIAGAPSEVAPFGILVRVLTMTRTDGNVILSTEPAALEDAVTNGAYQVSIALTSDMVDQAQLPEGIRLVPGSQPTGELYFEVEDFPFYDEDGNYETQSDQIRANGAIRMSPTLQHGQGIFGGDPESFNFIVTVDETAEIEFEYGADIDLVNRDNEIGNPIFFTPIVVFMGPVPYTFVPVLTWHLGVKVSLDAGLTTGLSRTSHSWGGVRCRSVLHCEPVGGRTVADVAYTPTVSFLQANAKGTFGPRFNLLFYGLSGSYTDFNGFVELEASPSQSPWWTLYGGLEAQSGVRFGPFISPDFLVFGYRQLIASAPSSTPTPTRTVTPPGPTSTPNTTPTPTGTPNPSGTTTLVSFGYDGTQGNYHSEPSDISANGQFIAFASIASNIVPGDTNQAGDVFVFDVQNNSTTRVSVATDGTQANHISWWPSISGDGRYIAFKSPASNLVPDDTQVYDDVFVHDRVNHTTIMVSVSSDGVQGNNTSSEPIISADGRFVVFWSAADNLVPDDTNNTTDIFVRDIQTQTTERVSVSSTGMQGNAGAGDPAISADGRYIAFGSGADNLVENDTNEAPDVFVHDRTTGHTTLVSVAVDGGMNNGYSWDPAISADGRFVAFGSTADNLVEHDSENLEDVFVRDLQLGVTRLVSRDSNGNQANAGAHDAAISDDGRFVVFTSDASNLVESDTNNTTDTFLHNIETGITIRVSVNSEGQEANNGAYHATLSFDGHRISFSSPSTNLVPNDTNQARDVFLRELTILP